MWLQLLERSLMRSIFCFASVMILLVAQTALAEVCELRSLGNDVQGGTSVIVGYFTSGMEHSGFSPCGSNKAFWWVHAPKHYEMLTRELMKLGESRYSSYPSKKLFVKAEACVSVPGTYGHLGQYPRYVEFLELLEYHPQTEEDCPPVGVVK